MSRLISSAVPVLRPHNDKYEAVFVFAVFEAIYQDNQDVSTNITTHHNKHDQSEHHHHNYLDMCLHLSTNYHIPITNHVHSTHQNSVGPPA
jgi:hypothetical protein